MEEASGVNSGDNDIIGVTTSNNSKVLKKEDLEGKVHNFSNSKNKKNPFLCNPANGGKVTKIK